MLCSAGWPELSQTEEPGISYAGPVQGRERRDPATGGAALPTRPVSVNQNGLLTLKLSGLRSSEFIPITCLSSHLQPFP